MALFWGELIDKYKDINANSKTVFTDYAILKLVLYSPHMFLLFCQSKVGVVKKNLGRSVSYKNDHVRCFFISIESKVFLSEVFNISH